MVYIWDGTPHIGDLCAAVLRIYGADGLVYNYLIGVKHTDVSPDTNKLARVLTELLTTPSDDLVYLTQYQLSSFLSFCLFNLTLGHVWLRSRLARLAMLLA
jgi:hypothetical protein